MLHKKVSSIIKFFIAITLVFSIPLLQTRERVRADTPERTPVFGPHGGSATGAQLAAAMDIPSDRIISASLGNSDMAGAHVFTSSLSGFPSNGGSFGAISSGNAENATRPNSEGSLSTELGGLNNSQGNDLVQLTLVLKVPSGSTYWSVDWKFFSEEYPEWVGSPYNDAFLIETPASNFTISGNSISAPNNKAFDPSGHLVSINTTGAVGMSSTNSNGTTYDGATTKLSTVGAIPPGASQVTIVFSVMDLGDSIYDTTVFLDNFRFIQGTPPSPLPQQMKIPVRWCVLQGSPSFNNPSLVGASSWTEALRQRLSRVSDNIFIPQSNTNILFRSGATSNFPMIPILTDNDLTKGQPGDIVMVLNSSGNCGDCNQPNEVINQCRNAWSKIDKSVTGIVAVQINRFINSDGTRNEWRGFAHIPAQGNTSSQISNADLVVIDNAYVFPGSSLRVFKEDPVDKWLGHELGHTLSLHHPNTNLQGQNLMEYQTTGINVTTNQSTQVRSQAQLIPDMIVDPLPQPLGSVGVDELGELDENYGYIDINTVAFVEDQVQQMSTISINTNGMMPNDITDLEFYFFIDTDDDPMTGGSPNSVGAPTTSSGFELVGLIRLDVNNGIVQTNPSLWLYQNGQFIIADDPAIQTMISKTKASATDPDTIPSMLEFERGQEIELNIPNSLIGPINNEFRVGAVALDTGLDLSDNTENTLSLSLPVYPSCQVTPSVAKPGDIVSIDSNNLIPNSIGSLILDENLITTNAVDASGHTNITFNIPVDTAPGNRLLTVVSEDSLVTADCSIFVSNPPIFDIPPTPQAGTEHNVYVGDTIDINIQASDQNVEDLVDLGAVGLPIGASFSSTTGNPSKGSFSWIPDPGQEGVYVITFTATDNHGISAEPLSIVVVVQPPPNLPPILINPGEQYIQYSDPLTFNVGATDPDNSIETLSFTANGLPTDLTFTDNSDGTATISGIMTAAPGTYDVEIMVTDPGGLSDSIIVPIVVGQEDTHVTYTGPMLVSTGCADCSTATVPLRTTIRDITAVAGDPAYDEFPGDITNTTVSFVNRDQGNAVLCSTNVVLFGQADATTGSATCDWTVDIGTSDGADYTIGVVVDGYYMRDSTEDDTVVVVSKPSTNFITGGGFLINQNSAGAYAGNASLKTNFGFIVKFNKKGKSLIGGVTLIVRKDGHVYQIKTNALSSLIAIPGSNGNPASAELLAKANITDVTDPLNPISVAGNATLSLTMKEYGEPGGATGDTLGVTVWGKNGELLFSSNWSGVKTAEQTLDGGNLQIHLDSKIASLIKIIQSKGEVYLPLSIWQ